MPYFSIFANVMEFRNRRNLGESEVVVSEGFTVPIAGLIAEEDEII